MPSMPSAFSRLSLLSLACCASLGLPAAHALDLKSADLRDHGTLGAKQVLNGFGCQGGDQSPQLAWSDPPAGTKSFVVTVYDPDAPTGSGWWHWIVYDIPADVHSLAAGGGTEGSAKLPAGAQQGRSDFGTLAFGGAFRRHGRLHGACEFSGQCAAHRHLRALSGASSQAWMAAFASAVSSLNKPSIPVSR